MSRLATTYLGLELRSPLVASSSPLTGKLATARRLEAAGASAIVLPSLFEEEINQEDSDLVSALEQGSEGFAEALNYFPDVGSYPNTAEDYLTYVRSAKKSLTVPVIASLNASSAGGWIRYAKLIEEAGADALELNLYWLAADPKRSAADIETGQLEIVARVAENLAIPLSVKLAPYYSSLANFAGKVAASGVAGLVLFNRFYQPDLDPDSRDVMPTIALSEPWELRLPLRWAAILRAQLDRGTSLAITSGVHSGSDAAKALLVGADVAMMASAVLHQGPEHIATVERDLLAWMDANDYESVSELRGSVSYAASDDPAAFERANYLRTLHSWTTPAAMTSGSPSAG
jgi:dihydroorotate dehydrogenase (fumarate)